MGYKRQTPEANLARSRGNAKVASITKKAGHKAEEIYAQFYNGKVVKGTGKTDVICPVYGKTSVKAPAGGKVQMLLQQTDYVRERWGENHPMFLASYAQRLLYEDRHFNNGNDFEKLYETACKHVKELCNWLSDNENLRAVLNYTLLNDGEVDNIVDMYRTNGKCAYITSGKDFIQTIIDADPIPKQTRSGLRISISVKVGGYEKDGSEKRRVAFSFEVRSNAIHCKSCNYKMEGGVIFPLVRKTAHCKQVMNNNDNTFDTLFE